MKEGGGSLLDLLTASLGGGSDDSVAEAEPQQVPVAILGTILNG